MALLRAAYRKYLQNGATRGAAAPLVDELCKAGLDLQGLLLHLFAAGGPGRHRRDLSCSQFPQALGNLSAVHLGPTPPPAERGELWFDTCDLSLMLLVGDDRGDGGGDDRGDVWIALRPVLRFQLAAFLDLAEIDRGIAPSALDPARLLAGDESEPVRDLSTSEAELYLHWVSKTFARESHRWKAMKAHDLKLWEEPAKEWVGCEEPDDEYGYAVTPTTLGDFPFDHLEPGDPDRAVYRRDELAPDILFRAALPLDDLARLTSPYSGLVECGARVHDRLARTRQPAPPRARPINDVRLQAARALMQQGEPDAARQALHEIEQDPLIAAGSDLWVAALLDLAELEYGQADYAAGYVSAHFVLSVGVEGTSRGAAAYWSAVNGEMLENLTHTDAQRNALLDEAIALTAEEEPHLAASALAWRGEQAREDGALEQARRDGRAAVALYERANSLAGPGRVHLWLADMERAEGNVRRARWHVRSAQRWLARFPHGGLLRNRQLRALEELAAELAGRQAP